MFESVYGNRALCKSESESIHYMRCSWKSSTLLSAIAVIVVVVVVVFDSKINDAAANSKFAGTQAIVRIHEIHSPSQRNVCYYSVEAKPFFLISYCHRLDGVSAQIAALWQTRTNEIRETSGNGDWVNF